VIYNLIIRDKAVFEIEDAFEFYESKTKGLGSRFLKIVHLYLYKIRKNPGYFPVKKDKIREAYIRKFPFIILYEIFNNTIVVYAVFHTSRDPQKK